MKLFSHTKITQAFEYLISGGIYFWVGYGAFAILWSGLGWSLWWASITANFTGWVVNYLLQRYWVFNDSGLNLHQTEITRRYIFITAIDFVLNYFILYGLRQAGITPYVGQFVSAAFFTVWNYAWYRYWVFPDKFVATKPKLKLLRGVAHRPHGPSAYR